MPINIRDVAKEAGVSTSTASRAIRGVGSISEKNRTRVFAAVEKLHYHPNLVARRLKYGRTFTIGLVMNDIVNPYFGHVVKGVEQMIRTAGGTEYGLLLFNTNGDPFREIKAIETMLEKQVEGMIVSSTSTKECLALLNKVITELDIPVVSIDNDLGGNELGVVTSENFSGSYQLTSHLIHHHHHTQIGVIAGPSEESHACTRLYGCMHALHEAHIDLPEPFLRYGNWSDEDGYQITKDWLLLPIRPTAIFASNNFMGMGAITALHDYHLRVPEDIAVVTYDDMEFGDLLRPRLTSLDYAWEKIGEEAAKLALEGINGDNNKTSAIHIQVPVRLLIQESCGCNST